MTEVRSLKMKRVVFSDPNTWLYDALDEGYVCCPSCHETMSLYDAHELRNHSSDCECAKALFRPPVHDDPDPVYFIVEDGEQ